MSLIQLFFLTFVYGFPFAVSQLTPWYNFYERNLDKMSIMNGILPTLSCPYGHFRDFDKGIMLDGCVKCPLGHFGNTTNLQSPNCTALCPLGTYLDRRGGKNIEDCTPCPAGTFGEEEGLTDASCSGRCEELNTKSGKRYYGDDKGFTSREREYKCRCIFLLNVF